VLFSVNAVDELE